MPATDVARAFGLAASSCCDHLVDSSVAPETLAYERPVVDQLPTYPVTVESLERILEMVPA